MSYLYKKNMRQLSMWASKIIEYNDGKETLLKDKGKDIDSSDGVVMHFTHREVEMIERELSLLSRKRGQAMAAPFLLREEFH